MLWVQTTNKQQDLNNILNLFPIYNIPLNNARCDEDIPTTQHNRLSNY